MTINYPTYKLNQNWDLYLDNTNNIANFSDAYAVAQTINTRLKLWLGEYIYDNSIGMDFKNIMGQLADTFFISSQIRDNLESQAYVNNVIAIKYVNEPSKRTFNTFVQVQLSDNAVVTASSIGVNQ